MKIGKEYLKGLPVGSTLTLRCDTASEMDSAYQTALTARKDLGLDKTSMRISRFAKEMKLEVERIN